MRKTTKQIIVNVFLIVAFVLFAVIYTMFCKGTREYKGVIASGYLLAISIMVLCKYILFRRQNFLYFFVCFGLYLVTILLNLSNFEDFVKEYFGVFFLISGLTLVGFGMKSRQRYQMYSGLALIVFGIVLILIFGIVIKG